MRTSFFSRYSVWDTPIPPEWPLVTDNASFITQFATKASGVGVSSTSFGHTIYRASATTPLRTFTTTTTSSGAINSMDTYGFRLNIPAESNWQGASGSDGQGIIISHDNRFIWTFRKWVPTTFTCELVCRWPLTGNTSAEGGNPNEHTNMGADGIYQPTISGFMINTGRVTPTGLSPGLITWDDIFTYGEIRHCLALGIPKVNDSSSLQHYPGKSSNVGSGIDAFDSYHGWRFRLKQRVDLGAYNLSPGALIIARGLREYGAITVIQEGVGTISVRAQTLEFDPTGRSWPSGIFSGLGAIPLTEFEIVQELRPDATSQFFPVPIPEYSTRIGTLGPMFTKVQDDLIRGHYLWQ